MDCPRKYYFSYVEKIDHRPDERMKIGADEMGTIEHEIIQHYFEKNQIDQTLVFNKAAHEELCLKSLDEFLTKNKIALNEKTKLVTFYELLHYSQNGIEFLIQFCLKHSAIQIDFETSLGLNPWALVGSIDCIIQLPESRMALFDFKRSAAAIGSKRDTLNFEKIQIWVYLLIKLIHQEKNIHSWGYLNLSEIEASQIYYEDEATVAGHSQLNQFKDLLESKIESLKNEVDFLPDPRNTKVCSFCEVELFCSKGSC